MTEPWSADLAAELTATRTEQRLCEECGDVETALLLAAWLDALLDEWNRRTEEDCPAQHRDWTV
jgi:hypothetical protein